MKTNKKNKILEIDLFAILFLFWKYKIIVFSILIFTTISGFLLFKLSPKIYKIKIVPIEKEFLAHRALNTSHLEKMHESLTTILRDEKYLRSIIVENSKFLDLKNKNINHELNFQVRYNHNSKSPVTTLNTSEKILANTLLMILNESLIEEIITQSLIIIKSNEQDKLNSVKNKLIEDYEIADMLNIRNDASMTYINDLKMFNNGDGNLNKSSSIINLLNSENYHKGTMVLDKQIKNLDALLINLEKNMSDSNKYNKDIFFNSINIQTISIIKLKPSLAISFLMGMLISLIVISIKSKIKFTK